MNSIFLGKSFRLIIFVLPNTFHKIGSYADIKGAVSSTGQNVNTRLFFHVSEILDSRLSPASARVTGSDGGDSFPTFEVRLRTQLYQQRQSRIPVLSRCPA